MRTIALTLALAIAGTAAAEDPGWPRSIETEKGDFLLYSPQIESFKGNVLTGRSALSWTAKETKAPVFGVLWFSTRVTFDKDARVADPDEITVTKVRFPDITEKNAADIAAFLSKETSRWDLKVSLDYIQASLAESEKLASTTAGIKFTPPKIVVAYEPAVLMLVDGKPELRPVEGTSLMRVVNTPFFAVLDPADKRYYLAGGEYWYQAAEATGPYQPVPAPSASVKALWDRSPPPPVGEGNGDQAAAKKPAGPPRVVVATEPTELIVFEGEPKYTPIAGGDLLYAANTDGEVFMDIGSQQTYVLISGRWYRSKTLAGPWTNVPNNRLPAAFARIPPDSDAAGVLAFVAGTEEAKDALADAQIPQTTAVKRDAGKDLTVSYDGDPKFKQIEGTAIAYAVNTEFSVLQIRGQYWVCYQGVWYAGPSPKGPWTVSDKRPAEVDGIPPSAPVYNTKYVYVYQSTPEVVYVGYTPGYLGVYPMYGSVVYGTGWYYPPYIGPVYYYPRPYTYGFHVTYNPWTGFGYGMSFGGPFMWAGMHYGGYGRPYPGYGGWHGGGWYGPGGYRPAPPRYGGAYGPRPTNVRTANVTRSNNIYNRQQNVTRNATRDVSRGRQPPRVADRPNNVYADRKGNVYRRDNQGWEKRAGNDWKSTGTREARPSGSGAATREARPGAAGGATARPAAPSMPSSRPSYGGGVPSQLNRDYAARQRGAQMSRAGAGYPGGGGRSGGGMPPGGGRGGGGGHGGGRR